MTQARTRSRQVKEISGYQWDEKKQDFVTITVN